MKSIVVFSLFVVSAVQGFTFFGDTEFCKGKPKGSHCKNGSLLVECPSGGGASCFGPFPPGVRGGVPPLGECKQISPTEGKCTGEPLSTPKYNGPSQSKDDSTQTDDDDTDGSGYRKDDSDGNGYRKDDNDGSDYPQDDTVNDIDDDGYNGKVDYNNRDLYGEGSSLTRRRLHRRRFH